MGPGGSTGSQQVEEGKFEIDECLVDHGGTQAMAMWWGL